MDGRRTAGLDKGAATGRAGIAAPPGSRPGGAAPAAPRRGQRQVRRNPGPPDPHPPGSHSPDPRSPDPRWRNPVTLAIAAATLLALGLRLWQLSRPGYLFGLTEYDDGPYFGSAVRLVDGALPYRDFVLVQPPGITLLMTPAALIAKVAGTAWGMAVGRLLTALASTAGVLLAGLLVRHRGVLASTVACGVLAVYPDSIAAAHTVLVEPWLVLFCLAGAVAVFDGDRLAGGRRLVLGGVAFGVAGAVEAWAIVPALVVFTLCLCRARRAAIFGAATAAGFTVLALPFALPAPARFYQSLIVAQVGPRAGGSRVGLLARVRELAGLSFLHAPSHLAVECAAAVLVLLAAGGLAAATLASRAAPTALEAFAISATGLVVAMFCWPSQFHYHFAAFAAPFLGLAIALPAARLDRPGEAQQYPGTSPAPAARKSPGRPGRLTGTPAGLLARPGPVLGAAGVIAVFAVVAAGAIASLKPAVSPASIAAAARVIPPGACVVTDEVSLVLLANRFTSEVPGCAGVLDGLGTDLALSGGLKPATGAGRVPAVAALWRQAFGHAGFVWLSVLNGRRIAWSAALRGYFAAHFRPVLTDRRGDALYRRDGG